MSRLPAAIERLRFAVRTPPLVTQRQATALFTFNPPMTAPIRMQEPLGGRIELLGPPW
jgi:hypothetical protein